MSKSILTITLAVLAAIGAGTRASAQAPANVQAVDLGLPSGTRWASCNIGATAPEDYGNYYAWGETETKADYSLATYKYWNGDYKKLTKYCNNASYGNDGFTDDKTTLEPADDAAHVNWGEDWRMPTDAEWRELRAQCTWTWTTQNGVEGYQVSSKTNSNSIFLPAAGWRYGTDLKGVGSEGDYWSSSLWTDGPGNAWYLFLSSGFVGMDEGSRDLGFSVRPVKEAVAGPANVQATQGDTTGVTVTWDAVPDAVSYEITAESWDVAINRTVRTLTANGTHIKDTIPDRPALGRYTVKTVFADGSKSKVSEPAIGWAVLETMQILGVSHRWPWNGKVDIDVEYKTVRPRFRELFGLPDLPYPANVTLTAHTADGKSLPVRTLVKEPVVDRNYTVNRATIQNGTTIFSGSGGLRIVWDADADTLGINAPGTTITITASDDYARTTDSITVDVNTTKPDVILLTEKDTVVSLPWAARWADEASRSLNMQDGTDLQIRAIMRYATDTTLVFDEKMLSDEEGVFRWKTNDAFGVIHVVALDSNRATKAKTVYKSKFLRYVEKNPVTVERVPGQCAINIRWTGSADCTYYQIIRREVYRDGTRSNWENMAPVSTREDQSGFYRDIGVAYGTTYEYAALPKYPNPDDRGSYITVQPNDSTLWTAGMVPVSVFLNAQSAGQDSILLSWTTDVDDAWGYNIYRDNGDGQFQKISQGSRGDTTTTFMDTDVEPGKRYTYKVEKLDWYGGRRDMSDPVTAYSQLDVFSLNRIEPRFPWNGLVDVLVSYRSAREVQQDGTPHFQLVAVSGKNTLDIKTLTLASSATLDPRDFTLSDDGTVQRLVWDARTDLGATNYPDGLTMTVSCARVEPYQGTDTTTAFVEEPANGGFVPFDLRRTPEVQLGSPTTVFADLGWFAGATQLEVLVNGTSVFTTTDSNNYYCTLGKEQLNIWGANTLKLKSDNGIEQTAQIKYPDFVFTATQGNRDSIIVEWNSLQDIHTWSIRRRAAHTDDAFVEVALVSDTTRWADTSENTIVGEFDYTIMPLLASNEDAGPQLTAVMGYRAPDIAHTITITLAGSGSVIADKATAHYGETVTLTVTPATGYELDQLRVLEGETEVAVTSAADNQHKLFVMPANNVVVSATFKVETGVENTTVSDIIPRKVLQNGLLIIVRDGVSHDANGRIVTLQPATDPR